MLRVSKENARNSNLEPVYVHCNAVSKIFPIVIVTAKVAPLAPDFGS